MKPSEKIRKIWEEMKLMKKMQENPLVDASGKVIVFDEKLDNLYKKYNDTEILFGRESTLDKAIIFYLDERYEEMQKIVKDANK